MSFERAVDFDFAGAVIEEDTRRVYSERRFLAAGKLDDRLHILVFARAEDGIRVISFRRANAREVRRYGEALD